MQPHKPRRFNFCRATRRCTRQDIPGPSRKEGNLRTGHLPAKTGQVCPAVMRGRGKISGNGQALHPHDPDRPVRLQEHDGRVLRAGIADGQGDLISCSGPAAVRIFTSHEKMEGLFWGIGLMPAYMIYPSARDCCRGAPPERRLHEGS